MRPNRRRALALLAALPPLLASPWPGRTADGRAFAGPAMLTLAGKIAISNRGPAKPEQTGLFKHHGIAFEKGFSLDAAMLLALPRKTLDVETVEAGRGAFAGPLLKDVLDLAGVGAAPVRLMALDGYAVELADEEVAKGDWMLAVARDGAPLGIGDFGPAWLMRTPADGLKPSREEGQRWVWSVFYIEVL